MDLLRVNRLLLFFILLTVTLYFGRQLLMLLAMASMLAMLMTPLSRKLDLLRWPRALSSFTCVFVLLLAIAGILTVVSAEVINFSQEMPVIEKKATMIWEKTQGFIAEELSIPEEKQVAIAKKQMSALGKYAGAYAATIVGGIGAGIASIILTMVLTFLMIFGRERYEKFFLKLYKEEDSDKVKKMLTSISQVSYRYLKGRLISMSFQAVTFFVLLSVIGIKNAVLLGCIAGLLSIFPYIGPLLGGIFPMLVALLTNDSLQPALWVLIMLVFIQTFDNYFVEPVVVGGEVSLSALSTILVIIIGGTLWGVVGMIVFIPMLGIAKIIFDHVESLKPYGYLIGDPDERKPSQLKLWLAKHFNKRTKKRAAASRS